LREFLAGESVAAVARDLPDPARGLTERSLTERSVTESSRAAAGGLGD